MHAHLDLAASLHRHGLKATPRRLAVARLLRRSGRTMTPDAVWQRLKPGLGRLGLQSVYRILEEMTGAGLLTRIVLPDRLLRYAACRAEPDRHHHHLVCTRCGLIEVVDCAFPPRVRRSVERSTGFTVTGHSMQVEGVCPSCRRRKP